MSASRYLVVAAVCALGAATLVQAQSAPPAATLKAEDIIKARQSAFALSASDFGAMKHLVDSGTEPKDLAFNANALRRWANTLPILFPAGTGAGQTAANTRALPTIWSDRAGFDKAAADYATQTAKLVDFAKANDKAGFTAQMTAVDETCDACHSTYRAKPQPRPAAAPK